MLRRIADIFHEIPSRKRGGHKPATKPVSTSRPHRLQTRGTIMTDEPAEVATVSSIYNVQLFHEVQTRRTYSFSLQQWGHLF